MTRPLAVAPIETRRVRLRVLTMENVEPLRRVTSDPAVLSVIPFLPEPFGRRQAESLIARNGNGRDLFQGLWRRSDEALLGVLGTHLHPDGEVEIGYWLGSPFHGRGYASEVVAAVAQCYRKTFFRRRLVAEAHPDNKASLRVLEKAGFRPTGTPGRRPGRILVACEAG